MAVSGDSYDSWTLLRSLTIWSLYERQKFTMTLAKWRMSLA